MAFQFCDSMIHQYRSLGYVIFRQILPPSLIHDLRRATAGVQAYTRQKHGPQAQRLQPVRDHTNQLDLKPFREYAQLAPLVDAVQRVLTPRHKLSNGDPDRMGLLLEPAEMPWCTAWHRDIRETSNPPDIEEFRRIASDPLWFNQINCPLYEDNCTWFVPGSHLRQFDLPGEKKASEPALQSGTHEEQERRNAEYCEGMPGAIRASMNAGDFMLYHPFGWHLGNYLPDRPRVTIHDWAPMPELVEWYARWGKSQEAAAAKRKQGRLAPPDAWHSPFIARWNYSKLLPRDRASSVADVAAARLADPLDWKPIAAATTDDANLQFINLHEKFGHADGIAFLANRFKVANRGEWELLLGHDGAVAVFVDGKRVFTELQRKNPGEPDRSRIPLALEPGEHEIVIAFDTDGGRGWGTFARFRVPEGNRNGAAEFPVVV